MREHRGLVRWTDPSVRGKRSLPPVRRYIGISRWPEDGPLWPDGAWSVELLFDQPPPEQAGASESDGRVRFLVVEAPHERLRPGSRFEMYEGPTKVADVDVLD